jgi:hypothetical protein
LDEKMACDCQAIAPSTDSHPVITGGRLLTFLSLTRVYPDARRLHIMEIKICEGSSGSALYSSLQSRSLQ